MLQKLRSREGVDLPYEGFGRRSPTFVILGGIFALFVLVPFLLSPLANLRTEMRATVLVIGAGFGALLLVLLIGGVKGKFGWQR